MKKLLFILPLLYYSCTDDIVSDTNEVSPMISLTGIWKNLFAYYTNTVTGKIDTTVYVYPECPWIFDLDSDSTYAVGYYQRDFDYVFDENGIIIDQTWFCSEVFQYQGNVIIEGSEEDGTQSYYIEPTTYKWTANEYQIYWYSEMGEPNQDSLRAVVDYSLNGDTLIWESQHTRTFQGDLYGDTLYNSKVYFIKEDSEAEYTASVEITFEKQ